MMHFTLHPVEEITAPMRPTDLTYRWQQDFAERTDRHPDLIIDILMIGVGIFISGVSLTFWAQFVTRMVLTPEAQVTFASMLDLLVGIGGLLVGAKLALTRLRLSWTRGLDRYSTVRTVPRLSDPDA